MNAARHARQHNDVIRKPMRQCGPRDRHQKGAVAWEDLFVHLSQSLPKQGPLSKKSLFLVSLGGAEGDAVSGLVAASVKAASFPMAFLYLDQRESMKTIAQVSLRGQVKS